MIKIAPSLLAADYLHIEDEIRRMAEAGADWLHFDVMDGRFVPNITFGQDVLKAAVSCGLLPCDAHLMVEAPERHIESFARAGARVITVHAEATSHLHRALQQIRACGCLAGVALNPATSPEVLRYVLGDFDLALVMTVNPGFGGQKLVPAAAQKIAHVRKMLDEAGVQAEIQVDGGINIQNAAEIVGLGATVLVTGSAIFAAPDPRSFVEHVHSL